MFQITRLTVGLRYTDDHKERQGVNADYRFCFIAINEDGNSACQGARVGTEGFLFNALDRTIYDPDINGDGEITDREFLDFYYDGVKSFGARDTLDDLLASYETTIDATGNFSGHNR